MNTLNPVSTAAAPAGLFQRLQEKVARARFAAFSLLLHIVILVVAATVIVIEAVQDTPEFNPIGNPLSEEAEKTVKIDEFIPELPSEPVSASLPATPIPNIEAVVTVSPAPPAFSVPQAVAPKPLGAFDLAALSANTPGIKPGHAVHGSLDGRLGAARRTEMIRKSTPTPPAKIEAAVLAGLRWLKDHQNADGSWGEEHRSGMSGLALLAFLGHGELPESPEFGPTVKRGIDWLLASGTEFQGRFTRQRGFAGNPAVYEHGIAAYAMGEYFALTKDERVRDVLTQAIGHITAGQNPGGGWDYEFRKGVRQDLSVAGWQIQALKAAHIAELGVQGVDPALEKSMVFLRNMRADGGAFGYTRPEEGRWSLTGVGVLCTEFWKGKDNEECRDGIEFILEQAARSETVKYKGERANLYAWYYHTQATYLFGGTAWTRWRKMFEGEILGAQSPDGSWPPPGGNGHGPEKAAGGDGPVYRTSLCVLMLETYYRYLPTASR